jgi:glycosyltransferase involved in cell wall biosynthesis
VDDGLVEWWGKRDDMADVLRSAAIVALPTRYGEGVPRVLLEGAACGKPLVASDVRGCRDVVRHGENGLLVPPQNPEALADALQRLLENQALRREYGQRSRVIAVRDFGEEKIIGETLAVYGELLGDVARFAPSPPFMQR